MGKKQISVLLIIVLVIGLFPQYTVSVQAANRSTSSEGLEMIKGFEGFREYAYKSVPSEKYYTIGYGHYGADVYPGMTVTREQAEQMLRNDIQKYEGYVNNFLNSHSISVNQNQYDALVSFTYNLGNVWVSTPTFQLKTYLINGIDNYSDEQITTAFANWCKDGAGNVLEGLVTRRQKEAAYFLRGQSGGGSDEAPKIHAWISDEKMGGVPESYKLGKMYYLCYEVLDSATGNRFENTSKNYNITETIYGPDGGVANTCNYENSNNNWIGYSSDTAGTYRGVVTISGDYEGSIEVSYTLNEVKPQMRAWVSKEKMGDTIETTENGEMFYLCYELRDKNSGRKLNELVEADYTVTETIYRPDGSIAHTYNYESSDYNWIGHKALEAGSYQCTVTISGKWSGSVDTEVIVIDDTITVSTEKPKVTIHPTVKPTKVPITSTSAAIVVGTEKPKVTTYPTKIPAISTSGAVTVGTPKPMETSDPIISTMTPVAPTEMPKMTSVPVPVVTPTVEPIQSTEPTTTPEKDADADDLVDIGSNEEQLDSENVLEKGDIFEVNGGIYEIIASSEKNPKVEYVGASSNKVKTVIIPQKVTYETVEYKVIGIGRNAFKNNKKLTAVTIGSNVTYIGAYAFYGNSKLKTIKIKSNKIKSIQKKAFWGVAKKAMIKVPSGVKVKYKKMLKNAGLGKR